jgi:hypothetical protein
MTLRWTEEDLKRIQRRKIDYVSTPAYRREQEAMNALSIGIQKTFEAMSRRDKRPLFPLTLPLRLYSLANERVHPMVRYRRCKAHRNAIRRAIPAALLPKLPAVVTLTRIGPRKLDSDNLAISAKAVRDALAELWGVDDGSDLYDWRYAQESAGKGVYGVRIEVTPV